MINYKCPFTTSYSLQTGVKHSLGASVFTGYLGREGTRARGVPAQQPCPEAGGSLRPGGVRAACSVERPRASGSGARGASGHLARIPAPWPRGHPERSRQEEEEALQRSGSRNEEAQPPPPVGK